MMSTHEEIEGEAVELAARVGGVARHGDAEALLGQVFPQQLAQPLVVVDDEDVGRLGRDLDGHRGDYSAGRAGRSSTAIARGTGRA